MPANDKERGSQGSNGASSTSAASVDEHRTDSALEYALRWNKNNAIYYDGLLYPKGTLKKLLNAFKQDAPGSHRTKQN